jgi:hypothetical protein
MARRIDSHGVGRLADDSDLNQAISIPLSAAGDVARRAIDNARIDPPRSDTQPKGIMQSLRHLIRQFLAIMATMFALPAGAPCAAAADTKPSPTSVSSSRMTCAPIISAPKGKGKPGAQ